MIADHVRLHEHSRLDRGGAPTLLANPGVDTVCAPRFARDNQYLAGTRTLKNENDRCANTCHLQSEFYVDVSGISIE